MSTDVSPQPDLTFINGINGATGESYGSPVSPAALGEALLQEKGEPELARALRERVRLAERHLAVRTGTDPTSLPQAGWGVIFPSNSPPMIAEALKPLLDLRRKQAGARFREFTGSNGYHSGDTALDFLARQGAGPGQADPEKVPYYLLLAGGPESIPFSFQYRLDVDYAVGRLAFPDPADYARYAENIAALETSTAAGEAPSSLLFSVANPGDDATNRSHTEMMDPLAARAAKWANGWQTKLISPAQATKRKLCEIFHAEQAPRIFFSASHGVGFPTGDPLQERRQGSILCRDWPGLARHRGPLPENWYFSAEDLGDSANIRGSIACLFACYGGGTPTRDYFPEAGEVSRKQIAARDFIARLPTQMLCHPRGGARAVVAHVERVWTYSFSWPGAGPQLAVFEDMLSLLTAGAPLGFAMEAFGQRYASISTSIAESMDLLRTDPAFRPDAAQLGRLWTARNDVRSFVILGDPAVRAI